MLVHLLTEALRPIPWRLTTLSYLFASRFRVIGPTPSMLLLTVELAQLTMNLWLELYWSLNTPYTLKLALPDTLRQVGGRFMGWLHNTHRYAQGLSVTRPAHRTEGRCQSG